MTKQLPSDWVPPDHLNFTERRFLVERAETINGIVVSGYIKCGQVLLQVQRNFKSDPSVENWFSRWVDECLPFSRTKAFQLIKVAQEAETSPELIQLSESNSYAKLYQVVTFPENSRKEIIELLSYGDDFRHEDLSELAKSPEVILEKAQEQAEEIQMKLLQLELSIPTLTGNRLAKAEQSKDATKSRLKKALIQLQQSKDKVAELEKSRTTGEILANILKKKVQAQHLVIENLKLDPEEKRKRALAQTVVDATKGLDLLLSSLDRFDTDRPELGHEAVETIERKMEEVKRKLLEHHARTTSSTNTT